MTLTADVTVARGNFRVQADITVADDEVVAVVGPNGAGKTTLLLGLAGLLPHDGRVDGASPVGVVFQDRRLFPHMSVLDNVAFATDHGSARDWLDRLGATDLADARPGDLSGGQAQRVAVARTLAARPRSLFLDEPFTALDNDSRVAVKQAIASFAGPRLVVTHAPLDAASVASRLVVIEDGRVTEQGALADLAAHPRSAYVADFVGVNWLQGCAVGGGRGDVVLRDGGVLVAAEAAEAGAVVATIHPRAIALYDQAPAGTPRNVVAARIVDVDRLGERVRVTVAGPPRLVAEVTAAAATELALAPGRHVWAVVKATEVVVTPA